MNCIIVDDELAARAVMEQLCSKTSGLEVLGSFENCVQGLKFLNDNEVGRHFSRFTYG